MHEDVFWRSNIFIKSLLQDWILVSVHFARKVSTQGAHIVVANSRGGVRNVNHNVVLPHTTWTRFGPFGACGLTIVGRFVVPPSHHPSCVSDSRHLSSRQYACIKSFFFFFYESKVDRVINIVYYYTRQLNCRIICRTANVFDLKQKKSDIIIYYANHRIIYYHRTCIIT